MSSGSKKNRTADSIKRSFPLYLYSSEPVFIVDKRGDIIFVNNAFCQKIGHSREEILWVNIG